MHCLSCQSIKCALVVTAVIQIDRSGAVLSAHRAGVSERPGKKRKAPPMPCVELFVFFLFVFFCIWVSLERPCQDSWHGPSKLT